MQAVYNPTALRNLGFGGGGGEPVTKDPILVSLLYYGTINISNEAHQHTIVQHKRENDNKFNMLGSNGKTGLQGHVWEDIMLVQNNELLSDLKLPSFSISVSGQRQLAFNNREYISPVSYCSFFEKSFKLS